MGSVAQVISSDVSVWSYWIPCYKVALLLSLNLFDIVGVVQRKMNLPLYSSILESLFSYKASMSHVKKNEKRKPLIQQ